jgi:hypothetical protein
MNVAFAAVLLVCGAAGLCLGPRGAHAEESATQSSAVRRAEEYAAQAFEAHRGKDYVRALALYRQAHDAAPSADILWNIAHLFDVNLHNRERAIDFYARYLVHPGAVPERVEKANARLTSLRHAERPLRRPSVAEAPAAPPPLALHSDGQSRDARPTRSNPYWSTERLAVLSVGAVGVAGVLVGTGYGFSAMSDSRVAHEECAGNQCRSQRGVDAANSAANSAKMATLALSAGAVALAASCVLWSSSTEPGAERSKARRAVRFAPVTARSRWGLEVSGSW